MAGRPKQSLMDYMVIGVTPALIMLMVGSLLFYLINAFYQGQYEGRLTFIMAMFVLAIVCIARISMERGTEYAMLFAIPLALVTMMAMTRFVQIHGPLASYSMIINIALIALVWWSAHQLTWDCTLIDDSQDASGEGLLQHMGLTGDTMEQQATEQRGESEPSSARDDQPGRRKPDAGNGLVLWWQRVVDRRRRAHAPGVWVVYYALAALPLFALGQWLIDDPASRLSAFRNLVVYVGSALGLLLTTSFLGLRRYLRQRGLEMPGDMAGLWLGIGALMIVALLLFCVLLPRPGASVALSQVPLPFGSPQQHQTHRDALGNEGPERSQEATRTRDDAGPAGQQAPSDQPGGQQRDPAQQQNSPQGTSEDGPSQDQSGGQDAGQQSGRSTSNTGTKQSSSPANSPRSQQAQQATRSTGSPAADGQKRQGDTARGEPRDQRGGDPSSRASRQQPANEPRGTGDQQRSAGAARQKPAGPDDTAPSVQDRSGNRPDPSADGRPAPDSQERADQSPQQNETELQESESGDRSRAADGADQQGQATGAGAVSRLLEGARQSLGALVKLAFWALLIGVAVFFAWKYRQQVLAAIRQMIEDLRNLLARLLAGWQTHDESADETSSGVATPAARPFADFRDPFASGAAQRHSSEQLIRYTFDALEAWAREKGSARASDQTPLEFAHTLAIDHPQMGVAAQQLADLYSRVAYGAEQIHRDRCAALPLVWRHMTATAAIPAPP